MSNVNTDHFKIHPEDKIMTISINATALEIMEASAICEAFGLELEFVLDEF